MARKRGTRGKKGDPINAVVGIAVGLAIMVGATTGKQGLINASTTLLKMAAAAALVLLAIRWWRRQQPGTSDAHKRPAGSSTARLTSEDRTVETQRLAEDAVHNAYNPARIQRPRVPVTKMAEPMATVVVATARPTQWAREVLQQIEWKRFEELLEGLWQARGYRAELTGRGADGGVDIRLYRPSAPDKLLGVIQCKSRASEPVGVSVARELFGVMHHEQVLLGILAASSGFTPAAREFAAGKHLQLWDGDEVLRQVLMLDADTQARLLDRVTRDDFHTPTCPSCDVKMMVRTPKSGPAFYGCRNYPRCKVRINSAALAK